MQNTLFTWLKDHFESVLVNFSRFLFYHFGVNKIVVKERIHHRVNYYFFKRIQIFALKTILFPVLCNANYKTKSVF